MCRHADLQMVRSAISTLARPTARFHSLGTKLLSQLSMQDLNLSAEECAVLASHCVICHQWTNRPTSLAKHVNTHLPEDCVSECEEILLEPGAHDQVYFAMLMVPSLFQLRV